VIEYRIRIRPVLSYKNKWKRLAWLDLYWTGGYWQGVLWQWVSVREMPWNERSETKGLPSCPGTTLVVTTVSMIVNISQMHALHSIEFTPDLKNTGHWSERVVGSRRKDNWNVCGLLGLKIWLDVKHACRKSTIIKTGIQSWTRFVSVLSTFSTHVL
jgi:hypothetical protein